MISKISSLLLFIIALSLWQGTFSQQKSLVVQEDAKFTMQNLEGFSFPSCQLSFNSFIPK